MGDRRPSFFSRFLSKPASRRTTASRTTAQSPPKTTAPTSSPSPPAEKTSSASPTTTPATPSTAENQSAGNVNTPSSTTQPASETISAGQTTAITPTPTTLPAAETQTAEKETNLTPNAIPTTPATEENQTAGQTTTPSSTTITLTTPLKDETQTQTPRQSNRNTTLAATMPPSSEAQMDNQTTVASIGPTTKSKTSSPTRATIQPRVPSQPTSPSRATTKSPSPHQPPSPSRVGIQSPVMPSSPSRVGSVTPLTPQRTSKPRSPSRSASRSPNQTSSPSTNGVQHTTKEIPHPLSDSHEAPNTVSNGQAPKPATAEQEPLEIQSKTEVKSETVDESHNQTAFETSIKQNEMEVEPSKSSELEAAAISTVAQGPETAGATQKLDSSSIDAKTKSLLESNANPEETKEVKDVIEETKCKADEKRNNEGNEFRTSKSGSRAQTVEEASITNKSEQMNEETQGAIGKKGKLKTSPFNGKPTKTSSRPGNKSISAPTHKFTQSSREPLLKEIKDDISTFVNRMPIRDPKSSLNDRPVSVITLAGENRGASMHLGSDSSKGEGAIHIHRGYKINPDESPEATIDGEGSWKGKKSEDAEGKEDLPTEAYVNNNTQGINNSIVFKSSIAERNPGVHMIVTHAQKEPTKSTDEKRLLEVQKAEINTIPSQKLTYEPNVRRRCLEGLLLESSDSDPENPEKPKRHGCRVGRGERSKYNTRDVL
ncbi:Hypothetical predicted protein [Olea europaea subsp. europaea]|uniref:Proteoglycan 4-like n=1 Tax=Olea europaea subsp. europaea TaxID=158383 RepID=A0A8S0SN61_OLEEU|nr:Hypothetical predicted protein [Olea europaea subsp. europaea]